MIDNPIQRVRKGAIFLGLILVVAIMGYRLYFGYDWVGSIWLTVVTLSSVGYSETPGGSSSFQLFTVLVIVLGMTAVGYTFGGMIQLMTQGEIERALGHKKMAKEIDRLKNHTVICGFGRMGEVLARDLQTANVPFVVIEQDSEKCEDLKASNLCYIHGDASEDSVLLAAGIERAATVVCCACNDAVNVFVTLSCRNINPNLKIIARAEHASTEPKLLQAGANRTVMPAVVGGHQVARMIDVPGHLTTVPSLNLGHSQIIESEEFTIAAESRWVGLPLADTPLGNSAVMVIAIRSADHEIRFNPPADHVLCECDTVIAMGPRHHLDGLCLEESMTGQGYCLNA